MSAFQAEVIQSTAAAVIRFITVWSEHPQESGMTYFSHMRTALSMARKMAYSAVCLCLHAVFPFWCQTTGSTLISELHKEHQRPSIITVKDEPVGAEPDYSAARAAAISVSTPRQCGFRPALAASAGESSIPPEGKGA